MKYVDEYRDDALAGALVGEISRCVTRPWVLMEICGGQTYTIVRYGIDQLLPSQIQLVHGPGCPVCVTPLALVDEAQRLAARPEIILVSFGDMLRVPGSHSTLLQVRAQGGDVRVVYSPQGALSIARENPDRQVIFFAVGFETTAPATAATVWQAARKKLPNFSALVCHMLIPPAIRGLLSSPKNRVQGLIAPGHVCTVSGYREYEVLSREFHVPIVVGGFEPLDLLQAISILVRQLEEGRAGVENQYVRSVRAQGNIWAQRMIASVYEVCDRSWRGLGLIPKSGLRLRPEFAAYDAEKVFGEMGIGVKEAAACLSAEVLRGLRKPPECPEFGTRCTPQTPLGAPMVSSEGACGAYYQYRRRGFGELKEANHVQ